MVVVEGAVVVVGAIVVVVGAADVLVVVTDVVVVLGAAVVVVADDLGFRVVEVVASEVVVVGLSPGWSGGCCPAAPASPISAPATTPLHTSAVPVMANRRLMRLWRSISKPPP
ncbi:MAG TPA: hypothetical protein VGL92_07505 [Acidimicrobiia bacterium]